MNSQKPRFAQFRTAALASALVLGCAFAAAPVFAASAGGNQDVLSAQSVGGVSYLNGGIGEAEQDQMRRDAKGWPLHMTFSEGKAGAFVADAQVTITDKAGKTVFTLSGAGPLTYVKLSPGDYHVVASHNSKRLARQVHVGHKSENLYFRW